MSIKPFVSFVFACAAAVALVLVTADSSHAITKCKVKVDKKTGLIQVDATGLAGPLQWGGQSGGVDNSFFNDATCVASGRAKRCTLADPADMDSKTPPAGCTIHLDDGGTPCSAWVKGCTPGQRAASLSQTVDESGNDVVEIQSDILKFRSPLPSPGARAASRGAALPGIGETESFCVGTGYSSEGGLGESYACTSDSDCNDICAFGAGALLANACTEHLQCNAEGTGNGQCPSDAICQEYAVMVISGNNVYFAGFNVHVRSGSGATDGDAGAGTTVNGLGNLIVGYDESSGDDKTGSHNLVVGPYNSYSSYGGFVAGYSNSVSGRYSSVSGGAHNTASGNRSSVSGGQENTASGGLSSVSGGYQNTVSGGYSSVSGGYKNIAGRTCSGGLVGSACVADLQCDTSEGAGDGVCAAFTVGYYSSVSGGAHNAADGNFSSVSGGLGNTASGDRSSVSGGEYNTASSEGASVSGGANNTASGPDSSVSGGSHNTASETDSSVSGGENNTASGLRSSVSGGIFNTASGGYSSVSGGGDNVASGGWSSVSGGYQNIAGRICTSGSVGEACTSDLKCDTSVGAGDGVCNSSAVGQYSSVSGGRTNTASSAWSSVSGGESNMASSGSSSVSGGLNNNADNSWASVSGGWSNTAGGPYSSVSGGNGNNATGTNSSVSGGNLNTASGAWSSVSGGGSRTAASGEDWAAGSLFEDQ